jgi:hypothetical protein
MATEHTTCRPGLVRCGIVAGTDEAGRLRRQRPFPGLEMASETAAAHGASPDPAGVLPDRLARVLCQGRVEDERATA